MITGFGRQISLGLTQLRYSASQSRVFAYGSMVLSDLSVAVFPRVARKNRTLLKIEYRDLLKS